MCGRLRDPSQRCPHCGNTPEVLAAELERINKAIASMNTEDLSLVAQRKKLSQQLQAAMHQRNLISHAVAEQQKRAQVPHQRSRLFGGPRRGASNRLGNANVGNVGSLKSGLPAQGTPLKPMAGAGNRKPGERVAPLQTPPPEASPRTVQNVLLVAGGLLLGVAAVVFAVLASGLATAGGLGVLAAVTAGMLGGAFFLIRARLVSTAETLTTVGLLLVPVDGYLVSQLPPIAKSGVPAATIAGVIFGVTTAIAFVLHRATKLSTARYAVVLYAQPVLPLLAYPMIKDAAGFALVFAVLAAADAIIARSIELSQREPLAIGGQHPLMHPEVLEGAWSSFWLRELTWALHGVAVLTSIAFGTAALWRPDTVAEAARGGATLLLGCGVGLLGALILRTRPLPDVAAGALTLAWIAVSGRVASQALPHQTLLVLAVALVVTGFGVRVIPPAARRGPQIASTLAVATVGAFVIGAAVRAAVAPIRAGLPIWHQKAPEEYQAILGLASSTMGASLVLTIALTALAAALALPPAFRREVAVGAAAFAGLAAPASLRLPEVATLWVLAGTAIAIAAVGIGIGALNIKASPAVKAAEPQRTNGVYKLADQWFGPADAAQYGAPGIAANTARSARAHAIATAVVGVVAILASLNRPSATAMVLAVITVAGVVLTIAHDLLPTAEEPASAQTTQSLSQIGEPRRSVTQVIADTSAGAAAFAAPSAVAAIVVTLAPAASAAQPSIPLVAAALTASGTLGYVALRQVAHRVIGMPLAIGSGLGALVITLATFGVRRTEFADTLVATLMLVGAVLLILSSSIDSGMRRADRMYDGADYAAAMVVAGAIAAVTRAVSLVDEHVWLTVAALMVLLTAMGIRALREEYRRGPVLGAAAAGLVVLLYAGYPALLNGIRAVSVQGGLWSGDLKPQMAAASPLGWQGPLALVVLAVAATIGLPKPRNYDAAALCAGLATVGAPAALGWPWWSPIVLGLVTACAFAIAATVAPEPHAGYARITVAIALACYALGAALVRPETTAAALAVVGLIGVTIVGLSSVMGRVVVSGEVSTVDIRAAQLAQASHLGMIGGTGTVAVLLAAPGTVAVLAFMSGGDRTLILTAALATISLGLAVVGLIRRTIAAYLGWASVGVAVAGTAVAIGEVTGPFPTGVLAATAVLLVILAELLRTGTVAHTPPRFASRFKLPAYPAAGAFAGVLLPALLAVAALWPLIVAALTKPYQTIGHVWKGSPTPLAVADTTIGRSAALTAVMLTVSAAIAAVGFGGGANRAVARVAPVVALALLIMPYALHGSWAQATLAGLSVFTICMLGVALTDPPTDSEADRSLRTTRIIVVLMGLIGGGAGLAGALATPGLTIFTFGGAVCVGVAAALGGRSQLARILGWLFAAVSGELFVVSISLDIGLDRTWTALGVLAVGAVLIIGAALLPRFAKSGSRPEAAAVEWAGHFAAVIALILSIQSPPTVGILLAAWSAVLGVVAGRPTHSLLQQRAYFWASAGCALGAWWLFAQYARVVEPEAYTVPFALVVLLVGVIELRQRPDLGSRAAFTPGLVAAFGPSLVIVLAKTDPVREGILLVAAVATLIYGSMRRQRAPIEVGAAVTTITTLHALTLAFSAWIIMIPLGIVALVLGANSERRRRLQEGLQKMR
jgi:hypothetical protein